MNTTISVLIITKNRPKQLNRCLISLSSQIDKPKQIIIIDSSSTNKTKYLINRFKAKLPIVYCYYKPLGYPQAYNQAIKLSTNRWLAFLNDDCTLPKTWFKKVKKVVKTHPNSVIQTKVISLPKHNIYANIMGQHYQNWIKSHLSKNNSLSTLDLKCSIIPRQLFYHKNQFQGFDLKLTKGSEDIDLGRRFKNQDVQIIYQPQINIFHWERTNLKDFIFQHYRIAQSESQLDKNNKFITPLFPKKKTLLNIHTFFNLFSQYFLNLNLIKAFYLLFLYFALFATRIIGYNHQSK